MNNPILQDKLTPRWIRDLLRLLPIRSQFILTGNVDDHYLFPGANGHTLAMLHQILWNTLSAEGYKMLVRYNPVDGISIFPNDHDAALARDLGITLTNGYMPVTLENLTEILRRVVRQKDSRVAMVMDYASRIPLSAANLSQEEHRFFTACDKLARDALPVFSEQRSLFNPIIWIAFSRADLPAWFAASNNRFLCQEAGLPDYDQRIAAAELLLPQFGGHEAATEADRKGHARIFADMADALMLRDMMDIAQLGKANSYTLGDIDDAVRSYKTGDQTLDNPWRGDGIRRRLETAETQIKRRVKGQDGGVQLAMDILKRSVMGLTGAHKTSAHGRPRGVLFLAGPTGVGKTELAKALTESVFGNEQAYIRFDMSEFAAEHADHRLLGAPPSYVGYESGGELTNAVRAKPFCLLLFDEIEKAHPRILDKFLQILEDGRLTDGRGETVYFSESIIVFTSNLGIVGTDNEGRPTRLVSQSDGYDEMRLKVLEGIRNHFTFRLGRPEILNRLGDNIVVFDFIRPEVASEIFRIMLGNIQHRLQEEHKATLVFDPAVEARLLEWSTTDLSNGGRGIGSCLENMIINPLARTLFLAGDITARTITVTDIQAGSQQNYTVEIQIA